MTQTDILALRTRARAGDAGALVTLGKRLLTGDGVAPAPQDGIAYIRDAAAKGNGEAIAQLALFAAWGVMQPRNLDGAFDQLMKAAKAGWKPAQRELLFLARQSRGDDWKGLRKAIDVHAWTKSPSGRAISGAPRVRVFEEFASVGECDWLIERARNNLRRAQVYRHDAAGHTVSGDRTNSEADFTVNVADIVLNLLRDRIANAAATPVSHFEVTKLLHYEPGQQFHNHADFIETNSPALAQDVARYGQRAVTFLVYLNDDFAGGETDFPRANVRFKGKKGDALMFYNVLPSGEPDYATLHAGLPPTTGVKWLLSQWIRSKPLNP